MFTRRSLLKRLGAIVAVAALAPEIAFNCKLDVQPKLDLQEVFDLVYQIIQQRGAAPTVWYLNRGQLQVVNWVESIETVAMTGSRSGGKSAG